MRHPIRVLFLCTGNSARSQMAEGLLRSFGSGDFDVHSAGTETQGAQSAGRRGDAGDWVTVQRKRVKEVGQPD